MPADLIAAVSAPAPGVSLSSCAERSRSFASTSWAAAITAAPTPIVEEDPNVGPASGNSVSPISQLTTPGSSPSTPQASWVRIVAMPVPMSWVPDRITARPSACSRTCAVDAKRIVPIAQSAIPWPTSHGPSRSGSLGRWRHPNARAPCS